MLEKKPGPCRMAVANIRYYYDKEAKKCLPFQYGGCRGRRFFHIMIVIRKKILLNLIE